MTKNVKNDTICDNMDIKSVEPKDIQEILKIEEFSFKDPWSRSSFESELINENSIFLKATIKNKIVGYVIVRKLLDEFHILNIAVTPENRRKGIAQHLLDHVMNDLSSGKLLLLEVRKSNKEAISLYEKNGFSTLYVRSSYYSDGEDAMVMTRTSTKE